MSALLADTGALVALLDRRERYHAWAVEESRSLRPPLLVCEPVLAELCFLISGTAGGLAAVRANLMSGAWKMDFCIAPEREHVFALMGAYAELPMSLADACLVRMSELHKEARVFTLDSHFKVYRRNRRQLIPLIIPPGV
jgi:predicted nucleic acid-binding protein